MDGPQMPDPVPEGRFTEFTACISEGFCPSCRQPLEHAATLLPGVTCGSCSSCKCTWQLDVTGPHPVIEWRGTVGGTSWDILTLPTAEFC